MEDALLYAQFIRDVRDANMWIDEKANHLDADRLKGDVTSFDDKVRKLQKHQAFLAELQAHECSIKEVTDKGEIYINYNQEKTNTIQALNCCSMLY